MQTLPEGSLFALQAWPTHTAGEPGRPQDLERQRAQVSQFLPRKARRLHLQS